MWNSNLLIAASLLAGALVASPAAAQQSGQRKAGSEERTVYETICPEKDPAEKIARAKEFLKKHPEYAQHFEAYLETEILKLAYDSFSKKLQAYYQEPDAAGIDQLIAAGEEIVSRQSDQVWVIAQLAMAAGLGMRRGFYKDIEKGRAYTERALKLRESATPPPNWRPEDYARFRPEMLSAIKECLRLYPQR
jgi:hypothetical protein